jgi:hypothetical protein
MKSSTKAVSGLALLFVALSAPKLAACGFDGALGAGLSALHPKSISVAIAVRDAAGKGALDPAAILPIERGPKGYWRAAGHIRDFQRRLSTEGAPSGERAFISLLFVESALWSRLAPTSEGYEVALHTAGPTPGDVVIVTNEAVLASIVDGSLSVRRALDLGVMAIDGEPAAAEAVRRAILADMSRAPATSEPARAVRAIPFVGRPR